MSALRIVDSPELKEPTLIAAFAGWSDAGGAATAASQYLIDRWRCTRLGNIDAEEFYDFTQLRPTVRYEGDIRRIDWPENAFYYRQMPEMEHDLILFNGIEPHLHWQSYIRALSELMERFEVKLVVTLGAMFVEYPHTRPLRISGSAPDPEMQARAGIYTRGGRYEGPTGISGILGATLREIEMPAASIWANVPHYVSATPNPPATLALLRALTAMLEVEVPLNRMIRAASAFDVQLNEATSKNTEVSEYVRVLEERVDAEQRGLQSSTELPSPEKVLEDIENFLRQSSTDQ